MNSAGAKQSLNRFLTPLAGALGFTRAAPFSYARPLNEATATLSFPVRWDVRGFAAFTCGVGVRFESLAHWLNDEASDLTPTLATPIHFLREDRRYTEWTFVDPDELEALYQPILADLTNLALPFLKKYSCLGEVVRTVSSRNPKDWFNWNVNSRVTLLAAIRIVEGDKAGAAKMLDDALSERETALPKARFEIKWLRKRLETET
jgi:hypothetical protein